MSPLTNGALVDEVRTRLAHALATGTQPPSRRALARELGVTEHAARRALGEATGHPDLTQSPPTSPSPPTHSLTHSPTGSPTPPTQSPSSSPTSPKVSPNPTQHGTLGDPDTHPTAPPTPPPPPPAPPPPKGDTQRPAGDTHPAHAPLPPTRGRAPIARWPLLLLAAPAFVAIWGGWVGLGELVGFGVVRLLPGIWDTLTLNTAVTLPIGLETYAAYALHVALSGRAPTQSARRFAQWSAVGALMLGAGGQVAYHLMTAAGLTRAPWGITAAVAVLPVLVLGLGAALAHLTHPAAQPPPTASPNPDIERTIERKPVPVAFTEKCCSHCGTLNWDSQTGNYDNDCTARGREGKKCDTSGEVRKWDENNNWVY